MKSILIIGIIVMTSCGTKAVETITASGSSSEESFNEFFNEFRRDSLFQIERVKFPWTIPSDDGQEITINKDAWQHADFRYEDDYATRRVDAYTQKISLYADTVKIELRGVDNGIHIDFEFTKIDDKWFLVSEKDRSH